MIEIFGHRGASGRAPENTLAAFQRALDDGCDGIELDAQQIASGEIVVFHDYKLDRCSNGRGLLREKQWSQLEGLDCGAWYSDEFRGEPLPTLEAVFALVPPTIWINIEIKEQYSAERGTELKVLELVKKHKRERIVISSFSHNLLRNIAQKDTSVKLGLLISGHLRDSSAYIDSLDFPVYSYHPGCEFANARDIEKLAARGIKSYVWTVNTRTEAQHYRDCGAHALITNYPRLLKEWSNTQK